MGIEMVLCVNAVRCKIRRQNYGLKEIVKQANLWTQSLMESLLKVYAKRSKKLIKTLINLTQFNLV